MSRIVPMSMAAAFVATAFYTTAGAQAPKTVSQGVYTAAQATRGEASYKEQCAACHGDNLEGSGPMPPLTGPDFTKNWQGKTVGDLFEKTHSSMPASAPGTLTEQQTADLLAYVFSFGKYPAGTVELSAMAEPLKQITIDAPAAVSAQAPAGAPAVAGAGGARKVSQGVYTDAQAKRGEATYKEQCAACHGDNAEGSGPMPALSGPDFAKNWQGKAVSDLFEKTHSSMPATAPGSLTEQQTADLLAYLFSLSRYPAGTTELAATSEPLKQITLDAAPQ